MNEEYVLTITALDHEREEIVRMDSFHDEASAREAYDEFDLGSFRDWESPLRLSLIHI